MTAVTRDNSFVLRELGLVDYVSTWQAMQRFTDERDAQTHDEIWLLEHPPVFTQGLNGQAEHVLHAGNIPIVQSDRGGQVTYHGPGQLVAYLLLDMRHYGLGVRPLVSAIEQAIIDTLAQFQITAKGRPDAPGVYVDEQKICSLGLRIRKRCSYHGLALNVDMDLAPFSRINPCGFAGLAMTQMRDFVPGIGVSNVSPVLVGALRREIGAL